MRINVNLATQPYEAAREYRRRIGTLILALGAITGAVLGYVIAQRIVSRKINGQILQVSQELESLNREKTQAQAILNRPANRMIADQSRFLNNLFARKALSWTRVFTEMERIMPYNIHVVSMKPEYTPDNQLLLHMVVATDSRDKAVELVQRMEKSSHFREAQVVAENALNTGAAGEQSAGNIQFDVAATYIPGPDDMKDAGTDNDNGELQQVTPARLRRVSLRPPPKPKTRAREGKSTDGQHARNTQNMDAGGHQPGRR